MAQRVMLVAGEPSGDILGAQLAAALRARLGEEGALFGVGGPRMAAEGLASPIDISALAVLGVVDGLRAYPSVRRIARQVANFARAVRPDAVVLIDSWGFTLRVARLLRGATDRPTLIKYVAPQVWATRPGRAGALARAVDHLLTIHSFDAPFFEGVGLPVTFVGNPALQRDFSGADPVGLAARLSMDPKQPVLLLLPGSRRGEIERLMPRFQDAVRRLRAARPALQIVLAAADAVAPRVSAIVSEWSDEVRIVEGELERLSAMRLATVALACSGTVTTELAIAERAVVVAYRLGPITHAVVKRLIRTPFITLFNVAAKSFVAPELVQGDCNGARLAQEISIRLDDPALRARQVAAQSAALEIMRGGVDDPIAAAADSVIRLLRRSKPIGPD